MSLAAQITALATRLATESKSLRTMINGNAADLTSLTTTDKSDLVAAINELVASTTVVQQDPTDPGRTIYVQLSGDDSPAAGTRGNIKITET